MATEDVDVTFLNNENNNILTISYSNLSIPPILIPFKIFLPSLRNLHRV